MRIILFIIYLLLLSLYSAQECDNISFPAPLKRVSHHGRTIVYKKPFPTDNSLTGTGSYLKDVAYQKICERLLCQTGCCEGPINVMQCGTEENCKTYRNYLNVQTILMAVLIPVVVILICAASFYNSCNDSGKNFCLGIILILLFPIGIVYGIYLLIKKMCGCSCCDDGDDISKPAFNNENNVPSYIDNVKVIEMTPANVVVLDEDKSEKIIIQDNNNFNKADFGNRESKMDIHNNYKPDFPGQYQNQNNMQDYPGLSDFLNEYPNQYKNNNPEIPNQYEIKLDPHQNVNNNDEAPGVVSLPLN